ncbi:MAG: hypothetical protein IT260_06515 [Saprospiraceae bacterium]|nr:hypothetical protein [Saprospiraceae bacterium]
MKKRFIPMWGLLVLLPALLPALWQPMLPVSYIQAFRVMAKSGLRLRSAASSTAKVLDVAPFGATVDVVFPANMNYLPVDQYRQLALQWRVDTAGTAFSRNHYSGSDSPVTGAVPHTGYWWEVRYAGKTGYMFSGFLWPAVDSTSAGLQVEIREEYRLRREGGSGCSSNGIVWDSSLHWYALLDEGARGCRLEKTDLRFLAIDRCIQMDCEGDYPGRFAYLRASSRQSPDYLLASKKELPERAVAGFCLSVEEAIYQHRQVDTSVWLIYPHGKVNAALRKASGLQLVWEKDYRHGALYDWYAVGRDGRRQKLEHHIDQRWADGKLHPTIFQAFRLCFYGDLDGDGQHDYIVAFTHRDSLLDGFGGSDTYFKLYLSTEAGPNEVVRPVALLGEYYCG